jgi:L-glyceraldehyde 3-phosphate reductase
MLDREPLEDGVLEYCHEHGIGFIAFSPLAQGLLTDRYLNGIPADSRMAREHFLKKEALTPQLLDYLRELKQQADERGESIAQQALRWVLEQQGVTSVLVGASSTTQLATNLAVL